MRIQKMLCWTKLNKILKIEGYLFGLLTCLYGNAQETVYTLSQFAPLLYHPATPVMDHEASLTFFHEEYTIGSGDFITTDLFSVEYPIIQKLTGRRIIGIGLHFMEKDFGQSDLLKTTTVGGSLATSIQLTSRHILGLGMTTLYSNKHTSMEQLSTGSQWIAQEFRFDPSAQLGETFARQSVSYWSVGSGLMWQYMEGASRLAFVGVSGFHLNRPSEHFFQDRVSVPTLWLAHAGIKIFETRSFSLSPEVYYTRRAETNTYRLLVTNQWKFDNHNPYDLLASGSVAVILNYGLREEASLGITFNQPGFSIGYAYQFPLGYKGTYLKNGVQLGIRLSKILWRKQAQRVVIESVPLQRNLDFTGTRIQRQESEVEAIQEQLNAMDEVKNIQFELSKDFKFEFGKAVLASDVEPFLNELVTLLLKNPNYKLVIKGHTDNIGKPQANYQVSLKRAEVVKEFLIERGVNAEAVEALGLGDTLPVVPNDTAENRAKNRRVEFIIKVEP